MILVRVVYFTSFSHGCGLWLNATQDFVDHAGCAAAVGFNDEVGNFTIQWIALLYQLLEALARIFGAHEGSVVVAPDPSE